MLFFTHRELGAFRDTNSAAIDDYYYEHLGFESSSDSARRFLEVLEKVTVLLSDQKRPKIIGHEALHLVLLVDSLFDDYTRSWEANLAAAFDDFRSNLAKAKETRYEATPNEYWLSYGVGTRVNSDRRDVLQRRHEFFVSKMRPLLNLQMKDPQRLFGTLERELIYYRDAKKCVVCNADVIWSEAEVHHVQRHSGGGKTSLENGVLVHRHCHPKSATAETALAAKLEKKKIATVAPSAEEISAAADDLEELA